jgi:hypothetical protein
MMRRLLPSQACAWALVLSTLVGACRPARGPENASVNGMLTRSGLHGLDVADALEALIAVGADTRADREFAHQTVSREPVITAQDALAHAVVAGRLAQVSGLSAPGLVAEVERYARSSVVLDPSFRSGAARRLLGTLYVMAPGTLLENGDSEIGLEILKDVANRYPDHVSNRLRVAEAYVALGDPEPAGPHLCYCVSHRSSLRPDERKVLDDLLAQSHMAQCP